MPTTQRLRRLRRPAWLGTVRRTSPISEVWGFDRGTPIDRFYIERFLERNRTDIRGRVLEVGDSRYTDRFGAGVTSSDVLDVDQGNPKATYVADLGAPDTLRESDYDCFILAQTLQYVFDARAAVRSAYRLLRPGGVALITVPSVSRVARSAGVSGDFWRFTTASCERLLADEFGESAIDVEAVGNVLTAACFLMGLAAEELKAAELATVDPWFPVLVVARAVKRDGA